MEVKTDDSLITAERSRAFAAALWFRMVAVIVIAVGAAFRHSLPGWMRESFVLIALPLFCYNLAALLGRRRLEALVIRHPGLLAVDLAIAITILAIGGGWRNSYFVYTLTTLILFTIFLHRRGAWMAAGVLMIASLLKDPAGDLPTVETFAVDKWDLRVGAPLFYLCAALILGYFDTLLSRIERLVPEKIAETRRRVVVEETAAAGAGVARRREADGPRPASPFPWPAAPPGLG